MTEIAKLIEDMVRAGVQPELIGRTAAALAGREAVVVKDESAERRRERDRERKRLRNSAESAVTPPPDKESPPTPPKETNPSSLPIGSSAPRDRAALDRLEADLLDAAGLGDFRAEKSPKLMNLAPILALLDRGYDREADILATIRDKCRGGFRPKTWGYFTDMVVERAAARNAIPERPAPLAEDWPGRLAVWAEGTWAHAWGPKPGEPGCRAPPELISRAA